MALLGIIRRWHLRDQVPLREIAKRLGISRNTVRRYLRSETTEPAYAERQSASAIDPYAFQLSGWLKTEAAKSRKQRRSLKQLHEDLSELGFKGSYDRVAAFARQWREGQTEWVNSARKRTIRSHCAVNYGVEIFGDRWSLLVIRDIVFVGKKTYGQFLKSEEGIATNVLASRLAFLEEQGILSRAPNPDDGRKDFYTLTEKGLDLIPTVLNIVLWSAKHDAKSYVRRSKEFLARLSRNPMQVSDEVKALVRKGGCIFPEGDQ